MKMEFDATKVIEEIVMQAKENQEEFIFETIRPYCENILQMKINKEELKQILLNGMRKQEPKTIQEKQAESEKYEKAFDDGYKNGYTQARFDYEQQSCDDCISRKMVDELSKKLVHTTRDKADFLCNFWEGLRNLPSVTSTYDLEEYSTKLWKLAYERGKVESEDEK